MILITADREETAFADTSSAPCATRSVILAVDSACLLVTLPTLLSKTQGDTAMGTATRTFTHLTVRTQLIVGATMSEFVTNLFTTSNFIVPIDRDVPAPYAYPVRRNSVAQFHGTIQYAIVCRCVKSSG